MKRFTKQEVDKLLLVGVIVLFLTLLAMATLDYYSTWAW